MPKDIFLEIKVNFEEMYNGCMKTIDYSRDQI